MQSLYSNSSCAVFLSLLTILSFSLFSDYSRAAPSFTVDTAHGQLTVLLVESEYHFQTSERATPQLSFKYHQFTNEPATPDNPPQNKTCSDESADADLLISIITAHSEEERTLNSKNIGCCKKKRKQASRIDSPNLLRRSFDYVFNKGASNVIAVSLSPLDITDFFSIKQRISDVYKYFNGMRQYVCPNMLLGYKWEDTSYAWIIIMRCEKPVVLDAATALFRMYTVKPLLPHEYAELTKTTSSKKMNSTPLLGLLEYVDTNGQIVHKLKRLGDIWCSHQNDYPQVSMDK